MNDKNKMMVFAVVAVVAVIAAIIIFKRSVLSSGGIDQSAVNSEVNKAATTGGETDTNAQPNPQPATANRMLPGGKGRH